MAGMLSQADGPFEPGHATGHFGKAQVSIYALHAGHKLRR
jgi:hypothetical protein